MTTKRLPEFNTDEQQERYAADLERELAGAVAREDDAYAANVRAEIDRVAGKKPAAKTTRSSKA